MSPLSPSSAPTQAAAWRRSSGDGGLQHDHHEQLPLQKQTKTAEQEEEQAETQNETEEAGAAGGKRKRPKSPAFDDDTQQFEDMYSEPEEEAERQRRCAPAGVYPLLPPPRCDGATSSCSLLHPTWP